MTEELRAIEVIESEIVKDLLLFKIKSINDSLNALTELISYNEQLIRRFKEEIHHNYKNANQTTCLTEVRKRKLKCHYRYVTSAMEISWAQSKKEKIKKHITPLYKEKYALKKELAFLNEVADTYKIILYKK